MDEEEEEEVELPKEISSNTFFTVFKNLLFVLLLLLLRQCLVEYLRLVLRFPFSGLSLLFRGMCQPAP